MWFRKLNESEEKDFKDHARKEYKVFTEIKGIYHPVYQMECVKMNIEASRFIEDDSEEER